MRQTYLILSSLLKGQILLGTVFAASVYAQDSFQYFDQEIDYWNKAGAVPRQAPQLAVQSASRPAEITATPSETTSSGPFPWQQYLDPKNKEFFREGDYTPPEPFMEIVRNPSDTNLKLWFQYIEKKNELTDRLQTRMQEYLAQRYSEGAPSQPTRTASVVSEGATRSKAAPDFKRYRFRLYFDSQCPHCKRMFETMRALQERGYFVEARQVDNGSSSLEGLSIPVEHASKAELESKQVQSVPVLLVGDLERKVVYRLNGFHTESEVLAAVSKEARP